MQKLMMTLRIGGVLAVIAAFVLLFTHYAAQATVAMAIAVFLFAIVAGNQVAQYYHRHQTKNLRR